MKPSGALAVLLSLTLPGGAFAQSMTSVRVGPAAEAAASGAAGTIQIAPAGLGALSPLPLSAASLSAGFTPSPILALTPAIAAARSAPSAAQVIGAIPELPAALAAAPLAAAAQPVKPAANVPAALSNVQAAASKSDKAGEATWTEKLSAMFDGIGGKKAQDETTGPPSLKAFVVRHGRPMTEITLAQAAEHGGPLRMITASNDPSGLTEKNAAQIGVLLRGGSAKAVQNEKLAVDWSPKAAGSQTESAAAPEASGSKLLWPLREAKFLAKSFASSLVKPLPSEIIGGLATKTFPLVTSIGVYWAAVGLAHPLALTGLITLSVMQEVFHGFFLKSWNNFQEILRSKRGFNYQMFFNLAYMQGFGSLYRLLSWSANPKSITPPWSVHYWKDMAVMSVIGTFFGVLGYNALNALYAKGAIKRWQHSGIQQIRDLCFLLAAPFFASGSMTMFWGIFLFQQSLDLGIAIWAGRAQARPIVFVTSAAVADSAEFKAKYPAEGVVIEPPLKQAINAVFDNPLVRLMTWPVRALWKAARGGKK